VYGVKVGVEPREDDDRLLCVTVPGAELFENLAEERGLLVADHDGTVVVSANETVRNLCQAQQFHEGIVGGDDALLDLGDHLVAQLFVRAPGGEVQLAIALKVRVRWEVEDVLCAATVGHAVHALMQVIEVLVADHLVVLKAAVHGVERLECCVCARVNTGPYGAKLRVDI